MSSLAPESVHRTRLPNGMTVLIRRASPARVVAIVTYVSAGYFDETDDVVGLVEIAGGDVGDDRHDPRGRGATDQHGHAIGQTRAVNRFGCEGAHSAVVILSGTKNLPSCR